MLNLLKKIFTNNNLTQNDYTNTFLDNTELAFRLFNTLSISTSPQKDIYYYKITEIEKECTETGKTYPDRQKILLKCIELIGQPTNPKQRYIIAISYAWSKAQYRDKAIQYLELYLKNQLYEDIYLYREYVIGKKSSIEERKKHHLLEMYDYLGKAYIGIYDFDKALTTYEKAIDIMPNIPTGYFGKAEVLTKQNNLQECKKWLQDIKKNSPYYKINYYQDIYSNKQIKDDWFYKSINKLLKSTNEKIKKGYVYKPRKNKNG